MLKNKSFLIYIKVYQKKYNKSMIKRILFFIRKHIFNTVSSYYLYFNICNWKIISFSRLFKKFKTCVLLKILYYFKISVYILVCFK